MKKKELKELALKIIACEDIIANSENKNEVKQAKNEVLRLSKKIENLNDMFELDVYIQEQLNKEI